jgi:hypothetical protein
MDVDVSLCVCLVLLCCAFRSKRKLIERSKKEQEESADPPLSDFCPHASRAIVMMIFAKIMQTGMVPYDYDYSMELMGCCDSSRKQMYNIRIVPRVQEERE